MAMSAAQEVAREIARIAQTRVVDLESASFSCGSVTLKMVKTTQGHGWLVNDKLLFPVLEYAFIELDAAHAFFFTIKSDAVANAQAEKEGHRYNVRFCKTDITVWSIATRTSHQEEETSLSRLANLLKNLPIVVD